MTSYLTAGECPSDWKSFRDKCYFVSEKKKTYIGAQVECERDGGTLTSVLDKGEQEFINGKLELTGGSKGVFSSLSRMSGFVS